MSRGVVLMALRVMAEGFEGDDDSRRNLRC